MFYGCPGAPISWDANSTLPLALFGVYLKVSISVIIIGKESLPLVCRGSAATEYFCELSN